MEWNKPYLPLIFFSSGIAFGTELSFSLSFSFAGEWLPQCPKCQWAWPRMPRHRLKTSGYLFDTLWCHILSLCWVCGAEWTRTDRQLPSRVSLSAFSPPRKTQVLTIRGKHQIRRMREFPARILSLNSRMLLILVCTWQFVYNNIM